MSDEETGSGSPPAPAAPQPRRNGKAAPPEKRSWEFAGGEADLLWNEILQVDATDEGMKLGLPGRGADGYGVHITRMTPNMTSLGGFAGAAVPGASDDPTIAGQALRQYVIDNFHKASGGGPAKYQVRFYIKAKGGTLTQGYLNLPSHSELAAMMPNPYSMGAMPPPGWGRPPQQPIMPQMPPWGWGPPPWQQAPGMVQQPPPAPAPAPAPVALGAPPAPPAMPQLPPGTDPNVVAQMTSLHQQVAFLSGQLQQLLTKPEVSPAAQAAAMLGAPPPAPVAPAPAVSGPDATALAVLQKLVEWGVIQKPGGASLGAPATVAPPPPAAGAVGRQALGELKEALGVVEQFASIGRAFRATGAVVADAFSDPESGKEEPPATPEAPKPEDMLPWQRVPIGDNFTWALDKETGGPSLHGIVAEMMNKPDVRDRVLGLADKAMDLGKEFMTRTKGPQPSSAAPQLVAGTPQVPPQGGGGGGGGGWGPGT